MLHKVIFCSYHILILSVTYYLTDVRQHGVALIYNIIFFIKSLSFILTIVVPWYMCENP